MAKWLGFGQDYEIYCGLANSKYCNHESKLLGEYIYKMSLYRLINGHFVLILTCISLLLPRKCGFHVRAGSFVLSTSSRLYFLKPYLCSAVSGWHWWYVPLDSCLDPDKIHSSIDL